MKKIIITIISAISISSVNAQDLFKSSIPSTPAFSILGYEPSSVMRPTSTKKLSSDIISSFDKDGKLLMNIGLEVAPYWLKSRKITREAYLNPETGQSVKQSFKISAATVKDSITGANNLGLGLRFILFQGKVSDAFKESDKQLHNLESIASVISGFGSVNGDSVLSTVITNITNAIKTIKTLSSNDIANFQKLAVERSKKYPNSLNGAKSLCDELSDYYTSDQADKLVKDVIDLNNKRTGFTLEIAGASKFITTKTKDPFNKLGIWLNANNYVSAKDAFTLTGRWFYGNGDTTISNTDIGIAYIREENEFNVSLEAMARWYSAKIPDINSAGLPIKRDESKFTYRIAAQASYKISKDVSVNFSLGKSFEDLTIASTGFFSIFGFNYSLFNTKSKTLEITK